MSASGKRRKGRGIVKNLIKDNVFRFLTDKRKIIIFVIFAWFCGNEVVLAETSGMSVFEYLLLIMGNHYYIIYFLLISYLYFQFDQVKKTNPCISIRMKRIRNKYLVHLGSTFIETFFYIAIHIMIAFIIGITRLDIVNRFQTKVISEYYNDTLNFVYGYQKYFANPLLALLIVGLYMIAGLSLFGMLIYMINETKGSKVTLVIVGLLILNIMLGFKLNIHGFAGIFFANNYLILHHVLFMDGSMLVAINLFIEGAVFFGLYGILKKKTANSRTNRNYVKNMFVPIYKKSFPLLLIYVILNCIFIYLQDKRFSFIDGVIVNLLGYSTEEISFMELIRHILFYIIPLFFIGEFLEHEIRMYNNQVKIRYRYKNEWKRSIDKMIDSYIWMYVFIFNSWISILYVISTLQTGRQDLYLTDFLNYMNISKDFLPQIIVLSCVVKTLELIYYKNILVFLTEILKNRTVAFVITLSGFMISFAVKSVLISYGKSSLYYLCQNVTKYGIGKLSILLLGTLIIKNLVIEIISRRMKNENSNRNKKWKQIFWKEKYLSSSEYKN